jgi:hypothetical protein
MPVFSIHAANGFNYEYVTEVQAKSLQEARRWFTGKYKGDHRTDDFVVRRKVHVRSVLKDLLPIRVVDTENGSEVYDRLGRMIAVTRYPKLFHALNLEE